MSKSNELRILSPAWENRRWKGMEMYSMPVETCREYWLRHSSVRNHVMRSCGAIMWCDHVARSCGAIMWRDHVARSCGAIMWRDHVARTATYVRHVYVLVCRFRTFRHPLCHSWNPKACVWQIYGEPALRASDSAVAVTSWPIGYLILVFRVGELKIRH